MCVPSFCFFPPFLLSSCLLFPTRTTRLPPSLLPSSLRDAYPHPDPHAPLSHPCICEHDGGAELRPCGGGHSRGKRRRRADTHHLRARQSRNPRILWLDSRDAGRAARCDSRRRGIPGTLSHADLIACHADVWCALLGGPLRICRARALAPVSHAPLSLGAYGMVPFLLSAFALRE